MHILHTFSGEIVVTAINTSSQHIQHGRQHRLHLHDNGIISDGADILGSCVHGSSSNIRGTILTTSYKHSAKC